MSESMRGEDSLAGAPEKPQEVIGGSPNYNRLSAMIESLSLHGSLDDEAFMPSRKNSPVDDDKDQQDKNSSKSSQFVDLTQTVGVSTTSISLETPESGYTQLQNMSPGNRESMLSSYSGTVHEGVPVSYVVQKQEGGGTSGATTATVRKEMMTTGEPSLPPLPSKKEWSPVEVKSVKAMVISAAGREAEGISGLDQEPGAGLGPGLGPGAIDKSNSLKLLAMDRGSHQKVPSSIASGNLASESGHSHNMSTTSNSGSSTLPHLSELNEPYEEDGEDQGDQHTHHSAITNTTPLDISDHDAERTVSMTSSVIPPLETQMHPNRGRGIEPDREVISDVLPPVPPRSTKRPKSRIFIKESLEDIQNQLAREMQVQGQGQGQGQGHRTSPSHAGSASIRSDSFFSATELDETPDQEHELGPGSRGGSRSGGDSDEDVTYTTRPLPSIPSPHFTTPEGQIQNGSNTNTNDDDDNYEDIIEEDTPQNRIRTPQSRLPKTPGKTQAHAKRKPHGKPRAKKELRSFDIDTISQLLNVTKGTLIGSEFSNLGMKIEEKRALEKLVDSLSRLTADMVLDPEKFHEGLRRLERATKALDGF